MEDADDIQADSETVYAFLDSNILIHFPFIDQIDWSRELGAKKVCLAFSPIVLRELDDIKDGMRKLGRRDLAQRVSRFIGELLEPAPLDTPVDLPERPNTSIMYVPKDSLTIDPILQLEKQDDHLLAALLNYQSDHPGAQVLLVADDFSLRQRAKLFGITARTLPKALHRPLPRTEEEERLRKLEAQEPQVSVEFGPKGNVLELPFTKLKARLERLDKTTAEEIRAVFSEIQREFPHGYGSDMFGLGEQHRPLPFRRLRTAKAVRRSEEDKTLIRVAEELGLDLLAGHLKPKPRSTIMPANVPSPEARQPYKAWQANIMRLRELAAAREIGLFYATQNLEYYALPITLKHIGGKGVDDGRVTVMLEAPLEFRFNNPGGRDTWNEVIYPFSTRWLDKPDRPSAARTTPRVKTYRFGNLHPGSEITFDTLYLFIASADELCKSGMEPQFTIEASGLNMSKPVRRMWKVRLV